MHYVIIGNGIAGVSAARHIRKRDSGAEITVISAESEYFYSRTALMYMVMGDLNQQSLMEIWKNKDYINFRQKVSLKKFPTCCINCSVRHKVICP